MAVKIAHLVQTNAVFLQMQAHLHEKSQQHAQFYSRNEGKQEVRLIFSFVTTMADIERFVNVLQEHA